MNIPVKKLSLVIPVFNEESCIEAFLKDLHATLDTLEFHTEIIFVDDGSSDNSWPLLESIAANDSRVTLLRFSRNFGKEAAMMAGLENCSGDAAIILDADQQHPTSLITEMTKIWISGDADIIDGVKTTASLSAEEGKLSSRLFNTVFRLATGFEFNGSSDYKLINRKVINALLECREKNFFFRGMTHWLGFKHQEVSYEVGKREHGVSKWNQVSRFRLAITAITSFTTFPLHLITVIGLVSLLITAALGVQTLYMKVSGAAVEGFTTVILLILFFGSLITISLGIIGAYLSRIHNEVKARPRYIISESLTRDKTSEN